MNKQFVALNIALPVLALLITVSAPSLAETGSAEQAESSLTPEQERLQRQKRVLEAMQAERRNKEQAREKAGKEQQQVAGNCKNTRDELARRQNARYLYRKGKDGEQEVYSDEEHAQSITEAQAAVKKWCK